MKRWLGILLMLCLLVSLCACGGNAGGSGNENGGNQGEQSGGEAHTHAFGAWTTVAESTCAVAGSQARVCACGEKETQALALVAHTEGAWVTDKAATTTEPGKKHQVCSVCGATLKEDTIPVIEQSHTHSFGDWLVSKAATCTEKGEEVRLCTCGRMENREIAAKGHSFSDWIVWVSATCKTKGQEGRNCSCGLQEIRELQISDHNYQSVVSEPTCTEKGYTIFRCLDCEYTYKGAEVPEKGHAFSKWMLSKIPSCTANGTEYRSCICGALETRVLPAMGHKESDWIVDVPATTTQDGHRYKKCLSASCNVIIAEEVISSEIASELADSLSTTVCTDPEHNH
jgi:hypothetical protein